MKFHIVVRRNNADYFVTHQCYICLQGNAPRYAGTGGGLGTSLFFQDLVERNDKYIIGVVAVEDNIDRDQISRMCEQNQLNDFLYHTWFHISNREINSQIEKCREVWNRRDTNLDNNEDNENNGHVTEDFELTNNDGCSIRFRTIMTQQHFTNRRMIMNNPYFKLA